MVHFLSHFFFGSLPYRQVKRTTAVVWAVSVSRIWFVPRNAAARAPWWTAPIWNWPAFPHTSRNTLPICKSRENSIDYTFAKQCLALLNLTLSSSRWLNILRYYCYYQNLMCQKNKGRFWISTKTSCRKIIIFVDQCNYSKNVQICSS